MQSGTHRLVNNEQEHGGDRTVEQKLELEPVVLPRNKSYEGVDQAPHEVPLRPHQGHRLAVKIEAQVEGADPTPYFVLGEQIVSRHEVEASQE